MTQEEHEAILKQRLDKQATEYRNILQTILTGMSCIIESRDNSTGHHVVRTGKTVELFVNELRKDPDFPRDDEWCRNVICAAPMHDLGKISIPDAILQKPGRFTDEEYEHMKVHSVEGARIGFEVFSEMENTEFIRVATNIAHYHHEKWNGMGYPKGLKGEEIPLEARVMALADVFDALVSKRCYKDEFSYDQAFGIIEDSLGTHFDPDLGRKFLAIRPQLTELYDGFLREEARQ